MAMRSNNCKQSLLSRAADQTLTAAKHNSYAYLLLRWPMPFLICMPSGSILDPLKRLKIAAQHMNTSLREVLPYGEGIMGYFYTPRTVQ